jgi:hypothetical protein
MLKLDNLRSGAAHRWLLPLPVSVESHEQVLNIPIACRRYGSGKPSRLLSTEAWFKPTTSLVESRRETGWELANRSTDMLGI